MAEGLLFNMIGKLMSQAGSMVAENWRMKDDLEKLMENMSEIKAVVLDAEEQQGTNHQVQVWLDKLKDALYDADNLLDDFSTEDKKSQVLTKDCIAEVCIFFTSSNPLLFSFKMGPRVRDIGKRLEALNVEKTSLMLTNRNLEERLVKRRETHSFIREGDVIGREREKEYLLEMLLNTNMDMKENVSVISIVGIGGLGKTALAQLLYNEKAIRDHFELKMWVCVSDDFDVKTIAKKIIESKIDEEMDQVQQELRKKIEGRRYLLVLDDVWNEDRELWLRLKTLLLDGAKGSKIIITTRIDTVAKISGTFSPFILGGLDEVQAWKLFSQLAFEDGKEPKNQKLVSIGKDILKKCSGVPLAIRSIGGLMYSMETENDWLNFKDKDLVKIDEERGNTVFQIIKLSYDHLPIQLKKCFAFCSLFPKDCYIDREKLIRLWVAQGFVQLSNESTCLEEVGNEYFMNLVHRSFFQELLKDEEIDDILSCKMHDLMHDMATSVSRNDCIMVTEQGQQIDNRMHHLSFGFPLDSSWYIPSSLLMANKLRTFLLSFQKEVNQLHGELSLNVTACTLIMSKFEQLRVLGLNHLNSKMFPSCIEKLKHLRYLDLSSNEKIEVLPRSITKLYNLETLLLNGCSTLRELPSDLWKLVSLRHLELYECDKLTFMPPGIGLLSNLQTLTHFVLNKKFKHSGRASELKGLNHLRGILEIKGLECLRDNPSEARDINLTGKSKLESLTLIWDMQIVADDNVMDNDDLILQGLLSHHYMKCMYIIGFGGMAISGSIIPFTNLRRMSLNDCTRLQYLPQLHLLLHLKSLALQNLPCLEWIVNNNNDDNPSTFFPSLERIALQSLQNLKGWCRCGEERMPKDCWHQLKSLDFFLISNCPNLISLPPHKHIQIVELREVNETILQQAVNHSKVEFLTIDRINGLKSLSRAIQHLTAVHSLYILNCEEFDPCNDDEDNCYSMQWKQLTSLHWLLFKNIPKIESLPEGLQHVTTLERLAFLHCPNLRIIPEWTAPHQCTIRQCPKLISFPEGVEVLE